MKSGIALAIASSALLLMSAASASAEDKVAPEQTSAALESSPIAAQLPLPPTRPAAAPRRIVRVTPTAPAAARPILVAAKEPEKKAPQIWLYMGYGF